MKDLFLVAIWFVSRLDVQRVSRPWLLQPEKEPLFIACPKLDHLSGTRINDPTPYFSSTPFQIEQTSHDT